MKNDKGSVWRKWDLHLHTPASFLNNGFPKKPDGTPDWEKYLKTIESAGNIGVIGATDYFSVAGYKKLLEFKNDGRLANVSNLLPNIELRIDTFVKDKRINFHVIFSDELKPELIEQQFLGNLDFVYENQPQETQYKMKVTEANLKELGRKLKAEEASFEGTDIFVGSSNAVVQLSQVIEILTKDKRFKGNYLLVVAEQIWSDIPWQGQDHQTRKNLLQSSDMIFSPNPNTINWCLGKDPYMEGVDAFKKEFKTLKPSIHGSDAHELIQVLKPCAKRGERGHSCDGDDCELRFCWIKADPTFEGLKQLLYEPEDRVSISTIDPTTKKSGLSLEKIIITESQVDTHLKLLGADIPLNADLVAVTGAKGSGKTAFVDLVANCYLDRRQSSDPNSFVKRVSSGEPVSIPLGVYFLNGKNFTKDVLDDKFVDFADITYIAQAELEDYIFKNGGLNSQINEVVFDSKAIKDSELEFEFNSLREEKSFKKERIRKLNEKIVELDKSTNQTKIDALEVFEKKAKENLKDKKAKLVALEKTLSSETIAEAKIKQEEVQALKNQKTSYEKTLNNLRELGDKVEYELSTANDAIKSINTSLDQFNISSKIPEIPISTETYQPIFLSVSKKIHTKLSETIKNLKKSQEVVDKLESTTKSHAILSQEIKDIEQSIKDNKTKQEALESSKKDLAELIERRKEAFREFLTASLKQREKYIEITEAFSGTKDKVLEDVEFSAEIIFDSKKMISLAQEIFDLRMVNIGENENSDIIDLLKSYKQLTIGNFKDIENVISETNKVEKALRNKLKRSPNVNIFSLYRFMYGEYLSVTAQAKYKGVNIDKLSLGQKATVLIKVYLAQGEHPIIIDSHDDHLDNAFIMDELVPALREAKKTRQVIIVSNNGNVVVNSDADQVIIAHKDNSEIKYTAGSLENKKILSEALKVLEGGEDAFQKRQKKYRIF